MRNLAIFLLITVAGCAEYAEIRTSPPGAQIMVDGGFVGVSPADVRIPRSQIGQPHTWRAQLDGYKAVEGKLRTRVAAGRVFWTAQTLGILWAFKDMRYFVRTDVVLEPLNPAPNLEETKSGRTEERLRKLMELHDKGLITDQEYQRHRDEIIRGL